MQIITPDQSRQARREFGLSQADVAEATGLKRQYLSEFESDTAQRFTASQLRKLRTFYEGKLSEARESGEEIDLSFGGEDASPLGSIDTVPVRRFHFPVDDAVSRETELAVLTSIRGNDKKLADLLMKEAKRDDGFFGSGEFNEETMATLREAMSLLAGNYLMIRALTGWTEIGLSASNDNLGDGTVIAAILGSVQEQFEAAGLIAKPAETTVEAEETL